jgi:hypothetical protein
MNRMSIVGFVRIVISLHQLTAETVSIQSPVEPANARKKSGLSTFAASPFIGIDSSSERTLLGTGIYEPGVSIEGCEDAVPLLLPPGTVPRNWSARQILCQ